MSLAPDTRLAHYKIRAKLWAGGMCEVFLAQDLTLDRPVVLREAKKEYEKLR